MINLYCWNKTNNFGDMLSPIVVNYMSNQIIRFANRNETGKLLAVGSIMRAVRENDVIWGAGCIENTEIKLPKGVKILAVRGPLTQKLLSGDLPNKWVYGDPSMLLPEIINGKFHKRYEVSVLPHEVDKKIMALCDAHFININSDPMDIIFEINRSKLVITSSLHGVIISEVYGVPVVWVKASDKIIGGSFKFNDYFLSTGRDTKEPEQWGKKLSLYKPIERYKNIDLEPLKNAWKEHFG